jgi:hypothetical protein
MGQVQRDSLIPKILDKLLSRINRPNLVDHVITADGLLNKNKLFSQAFTLVARLSALYDKHKDYWHYAAIVGHTQTSKLFPLNNAEVSLLKEWDIVVVAQLFAINELTGKLDNEENEPLKQWLQAHPSLRNNLGLSSEKITFLTKWPSQSPICPYFFAKSST